MVLVESSTDQTSPPLSGTSEHLPSLFMLLVSHRKAVSQILQLRLYCTPYGVWKQAGRINKIVAVADAV